MSALPLAGRRVLVTRAVHQAGKLSAALRELGATPVEVPVLEIRPPESSAALDGALGSISTYDWVIFTSANAVKAVADRARGLGVSMEQFQNLKVAVIGEATASAAQHEGLQVTLSPVSYVAESLVEALQGQIAGAKILLARAAVARDVVPDGLRAEGAEVDVVDAYRNAMPSAAPEQLRQALAGGIDAVAFTSSSSVTHLQNAAEAAGVAWPLAGVAAVSIGPITSNTLRACGWEPAAEATEFAIPGLVAVLALFFAPA